MKHTDRLFRDETGKIKSMLSGIEGISYYENPLDFFILLARYKFGSKFIKKTDSVLDAGCGHGYGTVFLSKFAGHVTGADFDDELIAFNRNQYKGIENISFTKLDLLDIANHEKRYDVVISMDVIEHFTEDKTKIVAQNYALLTKDTGFALIGTPNIASKPFASKRRLKTHLHEFRPVEFEELLADHFKRVFLFSMTDEVVSTGFADLAWYLMALCVK